MKRNMILLLCGISVFFGVIQEGAINASQAPEESNQERRIVPRVENNGAREAVPNNKERRIVLREQNVEEEFFELIQQSKWTSARRYFNRNRDEISNVALSRIMLWIADNVKSPKVFQSVAS